MPTEKPEECDCCGYETDRLRLYQGLFSETSKGEPTDSAWYCDLCAGTAASTANRYTTQWPRDFREVLNAISYVGNSIIDAIEKKRG